MIESAADRRYLLNASDFGVAVVIGAVTTAGQVDDQVDPVLEGSVVGQNARIRSVLIPTDDLNSLALGGSLTVGGTAYTARDIQAEPPDGLLARIWLT